MLAVDYINDLATALRGNWKKFQCFAWNYECDLPDPENWCIVYTHNRDSGLLDESNAAAIARILDPHLESDDIIKEEHNHWACGWVAGYSIRVRRHDWDGVNQGKSAKFTPAFLAWYEIQDRLDSYPLLDEEDYSRREYEACLENIAFEGRNLIRAEHQDSDWASDVHRWLDTNSQRELENRDDRGGYPREVAIAEALYDLDLLDEDYLHLIED